MESLSQLTFDAANQLGITRGILGKEDEHIQFNEKSTTIEQAETVMGSIYGVLGEVLKNFDLTNKDDVKAARKFIKQNLGEVGRAIQIHMTKKKEEDENKNKNN